ncbi:hypothetical protein CFIMG_006511RA [Ceratocystis fimbriata CBS 114723]|uniref:Uncharacterized protein n=1 Tax=Ceratocystis fimbriata CBS 114723 TaxID=1035309 RepID=A0A2C5WUX7_9PEZI|nr:hypothetical protein CFIMG_006511RA [Ceratocystis fimbriata CBS 114723]
MRFSFVFSWLSVSLQGLRGSRPSSTQDVQPTEITESDYTEGPYRPKTNDITSQYYLAARGYFGSFFPNGETRVYSYHYDEFSEETMLSIYFDKSRQVTSFRNDNLRYEKDHDYKLPLHSIFEALCYRLPIDYFAMDWIVMDIFDLHTLERIEQYRESNLLSIEEDIRLTEEDRYWGIFSNTYYYQQASRMVPARIDKMIIRRQERWIEGTNYPATVAHLIMFSFKSFDSRGQDPPATDPAEIGALEVVGAAIEAVDETEAANLKKELGIKPEAGADTLDDFAEAAPEKSDTEPASEDS